MLPKIFIHVCMQRSLRYVRDDSIKKLPDDTNNTHKHRHAHIQFLYEVEINRITYESISISSCHFLPFILFPIYYLIIVFGNLIIYAHNFISDYFKSFAGAKQKTKLLTLILLMNSIICIYKRSYN